MFGEWGGRLVRSVLVDLVDFGADIVVHVIFILLLQVPNMDRNESE